LAPLGGILSAKVEIVASMGIVSGTLRAGFAVPHRDGTPFTDGERAALTALLANEEVWMVTNNHSSFKAYGLPCARDVIAKLIGSSPGDAARGEAAFDQAFALGQQGRVGEALPLFEEAVRFRPQHFAAWLNLGWALGKLERYEEAAAIATRGLAVFEESTQLSSELAGALIALKRYPECDAAAAHGLRYAPDDGYLLYTRACANALMGKVREALDGVSRTIEADPQAREEIAQDSDFDSLRSLPEFQALLAAPTS
jgi:tetratricopeptide (TPR) repeat protein